MALRSRIFATRRECSTYNKQINKQQSTHVYCWLPKVTMVTSYFWSRNIHPYFTELFVAFNFEKRLLIESNYGLHGFALAYMLLYKFLHSPETNQTRSEAKQKPIKLQSCRLSYRLSQPNSYGIKLHLRCVKITKHTTPIRTSICCTSCFSLVKACFILTKGPANIEEVYYDYQWSKAWRDRKSVV